MYIAPPSPHQHPTAADDNGTVSEPYRLYNLDVFEHLSNSPFGLYGSIPYLIGHRSGQTTGVFWWAGWDRGWDWAEMVGKVMLWVLFGEPVACLSRFIWIYTAPFPPTPQAERGRDVCGRGEERRRHQHPMDR